MKNVASMHRLFAVALAGLLAAGCAKKPAPSTAATAEQAPAASTAMPTQQVPGVQEQAVTEAPATATAAAQALQTINFAFNEYTLSQQARDILVQNAAWMKAHPEAKVRVEGNCDERGSEEYNLALGQKRAEAAKNYLVSLGVPADSLSVISYGEERPLDPAHDEAAWAKNRRDEFHSMQ